MSLSPFIGQRKLIFSREVNVKWGVEKELIVFVLCLSSSTNVKTKRKNFCNNKTLEVSFMIIGSIHYLSWQQNLPLISFGWTPYYLYYHISYTHYNTDRFVLGKHRNLYMIKTRWILLCQSAKSANSVYVGSIASSSGSSQTTIKRIENLLKTTFVCSQIILC